MSSKSVPNAINIKVKPNGMNGICSKANNEIVDKTALFLNLKKLQRLVTRNTGKGYPQSPCSIINMTIELINAQKQKYLENDSTESSDDSSDTETNTYDFGVDWDVSFSDDDIAM